MKVIARNNGPFEIRFGVKERSGLLEGKEYEVIEWAYHKRGYWVIRTDDLLAFRF